MTVLVEAPADDLLTLPAKRRERLYARTMARRKGLQPIKRVAMCGHPVSVEVAAGRDTGGRGKVRGVSSCGSISSCPSCSPGRRHSQTLQLDEAERLWIASGGRVMLVTLTIGHRVWQSYGVVRGRLGRAWRKTNTGRRRQDWVDALPGYLGQVRAVDDTYGKNGWHPHYHMVMFVGPEVEADDVRRSLVEAWVTSCVTVLTDDGVLRGEAEQAQYRRDARRACDVQLVQADETHVAAVACYPFKAAMEIFRVDLKRAGQGRSPWQLLGDGIRGDRKAGKLWGEYAAGTHRLHAGQWSQALRQWYMTAERRREHRLLRQAAARDGFVPGAFFTAATWSHIRRMGWEEAALDAIESGDVAVWAAQRSLPCLTVGDVGLLIGPELPRLPLETLTRGQLDQVTWWVRNPVHGPPAPGQRRSPAGFHGRRRVWIDARVAHRDAARRQRVRARRMQVVVDRLVVAGLVSDGRRRRGRRRTVALSWQVDLLTGEIGWQRPAS